MNIYIHSYMEVTKVRAVSTIINCSIWIIVSLFYFALVKICKTSNN
ncbi:hypothetical protein A1E_05060 [Rickettsia canadensis str. McKiel]|uniref:Uncharacterized protein n=1 Tax=Rickettsia canadensis (strain McKiel) TaxID=293613 RepID=A8EZZ5_RICCK|nr:hypothetical protein A1E_05060 [Rickettsia canadensis str. McKiel]